MKFLVALAILLTLAISSAATAQPARPKGTIVNVQEIAIAISFSGMDILAGGGGIFILRVEVDTADDYGMTISDSFILDTSRDVVIPQTIFGNGTLVSVVSEGATFLNGLPGEGSLLIHGTVVDFSEYPVFVPTGKFFTVWKRTADEVSSITVEFVELP